MTLWSFKMSPLLYLLQPLRILHEPPSSLSQSLLQQSLPTPFPPTPFNITYSYSTTATTGSAHLILFDRSLLHHSRSAADQPLPGCPHPVSSALTRHALSPL